MKRLSAILLVCCMLLVLLAGCGSASPPSSSNPGSEASDGQPQGVFANYFTGELETFNPHIWASSNAGDAIALASMVLYAQVPSEDAKSFVLQGELADGDPVKKDDEGKVWEIKIRKNAKWQNGDPINADDVLYSFKMCLDPLLVNSRASQLASDYITIKNAKDYYLQGSSNKIAWEDVGLKRIDDYTIGLELSDPVTEADIKSHFNYTWTAIVHKPTYEANMSADRTKTSYGASADKFISCGRFILKDWVNGSVVNYVRNPDYINDSIKLAGYQYKMLADANTALELFLNGELDVVNLSASVIEQYRDDPRIKTAPASTIQTLTINHKNTNNNGILGNLNFRKALYYGVDRAAIAKMTNGIPANYLVASKCLGDTSKGQSFRELPIAQSYLPPNLSFDPTLAKQYYDKALEECGLSKLTVSLSYVETSANNKAASEFLQKDLSRIFGDNFKLDLIAASSSVSTAYVQGWRNGDVNSYELTFRGWNTSTAAPWNGLKVYTSSYSNKNEPYFNKEYDALWDQANNSLKAKLDPQYRLQLTADMEKMALEDVVACPVYEAPSYYLISERAKLVSDKYIPGYGFGFTLATLSK